MNIYTEAGWPDIPKLCGQGCPFIMLVGGRGTGKTYSTLKDVTIDNPRRFVYLRRTQEELEVCMTPDFNPFRELNAKYNRNIHLEKDGKVYTIKDGSGEEENTIGNALALSSVAKIRGMSAFDTEVIIFDEFIKDVNQRRTMKDEAGAFFNIYETICRNRELQGGEPVQAILLANANDSANSIFMALNLVIVSERMKKKGEFPAVYKNTERGLLLVDFGETNPISRKKSHTALYRLTAGTSYAEMALQNNFAYNEPSRQANRSLKEYNPVVFVGELAVYKNKSCDIYYCTPYKRGGAPVYGSGVTELQRFQKAFAWLWLVYMSDKIEFESYACEALLQQYFGS